MFLHREKKSWGVEPGNSNKAKSGPVTVPWRGCVQEHYDFGEMLLLGTDVCIHRTSVCGVCAGCFSHIVLAQTFGECDLIKLGSVA